MCGAVNEGFNLFWGCFVDVRNWGVDCGTARGSTDEQVTALLSRKDFIRVNKTIATEDAAFGLRRGTTPSSNIVAKCKIVSNGLICMCDRSTSILNKTLKRVRTGGVTEVCSVTVGVKTPIVKLVSYTNLELRRTASTLRTFKDLCRGRTLTSNIVPRIATVFKVYNNNLTIIPKLASFAFVRTGSKGLFIGSPGTLRKGRVSGYGATDTRCRDGATNLMSKVNTRTRVLKRVHSLMYVLPTGGRSSVSCRRYASSLGHVYTSVTGTSRSATVTLTRVTSGRVLIRAGGSCTGRVIAKFVHLGKVAINIITGHSGMCGTRTRMRTRFSDILAMSKYGGTASFMGFYSTFSVPILALAGMAKFTTAMRSRGGVTDTITGLACTFTGTAMPGMGMVINGTFKDTCISVGDGSVNTSLICT